MLNDIGQLRWEHRLVLVFAANASQAQAASEELNRAGEAIADRDILWFVVAGGAVRTNYDGEMSEGFVGRLRENYIDDSETGTLKVLLIGKDGGVKNRANALDLESIDRQIDQMPMRREEMREN